MTQRLSRSDWTMDYQRTSSTGVTRNRVGEAGHRRMQSQVELVRVRTLVARARGGAEQIPRVRRQRSAPFGQLVVHCGYAQAECRRQIVRANLGIAEFSRRVLR